MDITHKQSKIGFMSAHLDNKVTGLLNKFRSGEISPMEFQELKSGINGITDSELKEIMSSEWDIYNNYEPLPEEKIEELYRNLHITGEDKKQRFTLKQYWMQIAASLLFIIAGGLTVLTYMQRQEINTLAEQDVVIRSGDYGKSLVTLPDGTTVYLNAKSSLTYSQDFGRTDRKVELSGEGFFEVKKDTEKKFTVGTGYMDITVLGTKFNVFAYENKDMVEMSLVEGSVNISTERPPYESINVKPNEKVTYNKLTGELKHERTTNKIETAWMTKELIFRSEPLKNVFNCLSRKFAVTFNVNDERLLNDIYTGTFDDENIESIMRVLKIHYKFEYENEDNMITINTIK